MYSSIFEGITFVEGMPSNMKILGQSKVELNGTFKQSQLKSLDDVKHLMAKNARELGGDHIVNFKYGQTSSFWKSLIGLDNIYWFGSGVITKKNI